MLRALMEYVGTNGPEYLNGFTLVKSDADTPSAKQSFYMCLGRHDFFLVPFPAKTSGADVETEKRVLIYSYRDVKEVLKHEDEPDLLTIVFFTGTLKRFKHLSTASAQKPEQISTINVLCGERQNLLTEFVVCLKASHMFFTFEIHTDDVVRPVKKEKSIMTALTAHSQSMSPLAKEQEVVDKMWRTSVGREKAQRYLVQGYSFYVPSDFKERPMTGMNKRLFYRTAKREAESIDLGQGKLRDGLEDALLLVEQMDPTGEKLLHIQSIAERKMREICALVGDYKLRARPCAYQKRMNLTGDPSSWSCWIIRLRTLKGRQGSTTNPTVNSANVASGDQDARQFELRNVTIIACRRNYIPPTMQSHADFVITHVSQYEDFANEVECDEINQLACDTLSPLTTTYERDELVIQATSDALLLDDPSYMWYESELRVRPRAHLKAREFCRSLFDLLSTTSLWNESQKMMYAQMVKDSDSQAILSSGSSSYSNGASTYSNGQVTGASTPKPNKTAKAASQRLTSTPSGLSATSLSQALPVDTEPIDLKIFRLAEELEAMAPGLAAETDANRVDWVAWRVRVWRYLAFCADGAIYKEALNFEQMCLAWRSSMTDKQTRHVIGRVLDKFIHLRQIGDEYRPDELPQKASSERLMSACTFNERVVAKLLRKDTSYIQACLTAYDSYLFPKFLVRLLCRTEDAPGTVVQVDRSAWLSDSFGGALPDSSDPCEPIAYAVLKSLVVQSSSIQKQPISSGAKEEKDGESETIANGGGARNGGEDKSHDIALNILVPALIRVFMNHPEDDRLRTFVVAILVNFSRNNYSVKANILAGGFAREIVKLLRSKDDDLVRHACSLLTNLTKTPDFRATIYRGQTKASLLDLVQKSPSASTVASLPDSDKYRAPKIVSQACQVLGNLAIDVSNRADLLRGEETQHDADGNYTIPLVVRVLADLVFKEDFLATFKKAVPKDRQELDDVRASALFALKNLSISTSDGAVLKPAAPLNGAGGGARFSVKTSLGRYASKPFLKILRDKDLKDRTLIDYLLRLLYSLSYEPKVALKLHAERIADGLALRKQDFANLCLQIQTKIANQQKATNLGVQSGGGGAAVEEEVQTDMFSTFKPPVPSSSQPAITGGILKQGKYASRQSAAPPSPGPRE